MTYKKDDDPIVQQLCAAFEPRNPDVVRRLLAEQPVVRQHINDPVFGFDSPAIVALAGDRAMVEVLLEAGADPNRRSNWWAGGFHPLHSASPESAELLLAAGAVPDACAAAHLDRPDLLARLIAEDPSRVHERGGDGQTPLHFARSRRVAEMLIAAGADLDARDVDHRATPAEWMLERRHGAGRYDLAQFLVDRGASADIFLAAALGLTSRAVALVEADRGLLDLRTGQGEYGEKPPSSYHIYFWSIGPSRTPLDVASQFDQQDTLAVMLAFASPLQRLLMACRLGAADQARSLVREHPGLVSALSREEHRALADAAWEGNAGAVGLMLELGFDPAVTGHDAGTALHLAAWEGSAEVVGALLGHPAGRALIAARDAHYGGTPLDWCCHGSLHGNTRHDHAGVARLLLDAGASPDIGTTTASAEVEAVLRAARGSRPAE
jgi:ankyrin repeat protein